MYARVDKTKDNKSRAVAYSVRQNKDNTRRSFEFVDNRPEAIAQRRLQEMAQNSLNVKQLKSFQKISVKTTTMQRVVNSDHQSPGRLRAALRVMNGVGGNQLTNTLFGFALGDTVADLRIMARRLVAQFLPPGGTVRIQNNNDDILDDGTLLIQDEQYTVTPIPAPAPEDEYNEYGQVRPAGGMFFMDL